VKYWEIDVGDEDVGIVRARREARPVSDRRYENRRDVVAGGREPLVVAKEIAPGVRSLPDFKRNYSSGEPETVSIPRCFLTLSASTK